MATFEKGSVAVVFIAQRTSLDHNGYAAAATAMNELAKQQIGYLGIDSVRDANGLGITVSYWATEFDAKAWRDQPEHVAIRNAGRDRWYSSYSLHVAEVTRSYDWQKK
jgi:heme-degrading monooxygenase HmoA